MTFLRPWFLLLLLIPFIFHIFRERGISASPWHKVISPRLLPYLLIRGSNKTSQKRSIYKLILWCLFSVAMAGPAFHKITVPAKTTQPGTILILDLGPTMQGQNLKRAQQKIYDLIDTLPDDQIGLILYDKYAYTAGPLTFETDIIRQLVPYLNRSLLPRTEQNPKAAFDKAGVLFKNANIDKGRVIFITTGEDLPQNLPQKLKNYPHKIGVLGIGSSIPQPVDLPTGGFLSDSKGHPLMFKLNPQFLSQLGTFQAITPNDADIYTLIDNLSLTPGKSRTISELTFWQDSGAVFVVILLPFFALLFRRGVAFLFLLCFCVPAYADLWNRDDQLAYAQQMKGVLAYREARYPRAEQVFKSGAHTDDLYNLGNALAFQQKIPEAIATYQQVLQQDPHHADARFNKEYLERFIKQPPKTPPKQPDEPEIPPFQQEPDKPVVPPIPHPETDKLIPPPTPPQTLPQKKFSESTTSYQHLTEEQTSSSQQNSVKDSIPPQGQEPAHLSPPSFRRTEAVFDQDSQTILKRLPLPEDQVLRYRIRQQYLKYTGH